MKLLILSDTHQNLYYARTIIKRIKDRINIILHLGDHDEDALILKSEFPDIPFHYIRGNCDYSTCPTEKILNVFGKKILMIHGHKLHVKWGYDRISYYGEEKGADILLFGHTHIPVIEYCGAMLLLNPGSISQPRGASSPTFGIIEIEKNGKTDVSIMTIESNNEINRIRMI